MTDLLIRLYLKLRAKWLVRAASVVFAAITAYFFSEMAPEPFLSIFIAIILYFPIQAFFEIIDANPKFAGKIITKRTHIVLFLAVVLIILGVALILVLTLDLFDLQFLQKGGNHPPIDDATKRKLEYGFLILGTVLGALLRQILGRVVFRSLMDRSQTGLKILGQATWAIALIMRPLSHPEALGFYVIGIASGVFIHKWAHLAIEKRSATRRRLLNIFSAIDQTETIETKVYKAIHLLTQNTISGQRKYKKLREYIEKQRSINSISKNLALISASLYRINGKFPQAIEEAESVLDKPPSENDTHLLVMQAINYKDQGTDDKANGKLDQAMSFPRGQNCRLANATKALWKAEETLDTLDPNNISDDSLDFAKKAMKLRIRLNYCKKDEKRDLRFLSNLFEYGVPVTATFVLDVWGYALLAAGFLYEARIVFEHCIQIDPSYYSAYIHLGDYYILKSLSRNSDDENYDDLVRKDKRHAQFCYHTAYFGENNPESRISRMAQRRMNQIR